MKTQLFSVIPTCFDITTRRKEKQQGKEWWYITLRKISAKIVSFSENLEILKIIDAYTTKTVIDSFIPNLLFGD